MQNKYWKTILASAIANRPKTHVRPSIQEKVAAMRACAKALRFWSLVIFLLLALFVSARNTIMNATKLMTIARQIGANSVPYAA